MAELSSLARCPTPTPLATQVLLQMRNSVNYMPTNLLLVSEWSVSTCTPLHHLALRPPSQALDAAEQA